MKLSILQISDLHRDGANPIRNDVLERSLENDRARFTQPHPHEAIRTPDIAVVTGDIVQGVWPGEANAEAKLAAQYGEALDFLRAVSDRWFGGDRERVIIVPGNHDVDAETFTQSARVIPILEDRKPLLGAELFKQNSPLRWSWRDFALYEIFDRHRYDARMAAFANFYKTFYDGARTFSLNPEEQFDVFAFLEFGVVFAGFSSCHNNDILNTQAAIHPACIGRAGDQLEHRRHADLVRIGVWHHNTEGLPGQSDYMNPDTLQNLIDAGFSIGLHGHQHKPQFLDTRFRYGGDRRITVVSAGTLCGGASFGHKRAYNIIELDVGERKGRLHLREMQNDNLQMPIWSRRAMPSEAQTYLEFAFDSAPPSAARAPQNEELLRNAQTQLDQHRYKEAAALLAPIAATDPFARRLLLACLLQMKDDAGVIAHFDPPRSVTEQVAFMDALWACGEKARLKDLLLTGPVADAADRSVSELRDKYLTRLK